VPSPERAELVGRLRLLARDFDFEGRFGQGDAGNRADETVCNEAASLLLADEERMEELAEEFEKRATQARSIGDAFIAKGLIRPRYYAEASAYSAAASKIRSDLQVEGDRRG
jgi:hypothetical protein